ncbi:hypothetical protein JCGZ_23235 [Jatropha curcas]|uniref:Uncharacterized protein n=1 Tax=Jatropha curcas TaxID=180498 RepID=A0A067JHQ8_JATCU|nr:hypothetical protein JCGZ_23235 [Jatropha curcas]
MEHQINEAAATEENGVAANQGNGGSPNQNQNILPVYYTGKSGDGRLSQLIEYQYSVGSIDKSAMKDLSQFEHEVFRIALEDVPVLVTNEHIGVMEPRYMGANGQQLSAEEMEWSDFINQMDGAANQRNGAPNQNNSGGGGANRRNEVAKEFSQGRCLTFEWCKLVNWRRDLYRAATHLFNTTSLASKSKIIVNVGLCASTAVRIWFYCDGNDDQQWQQGRDFEIYVLIMRLWFRSNRREGEEEEEAMGYFRIQRRREETVSFNILTE